MSQHDPNCAWERGGRPCRRFSTDGTALGADIAHTMGTTDEAAIVRDGLGTPLFVSDVQEEQSDWDADMHEPPPYPSTSLEWTEDGLPDTDQA